MQRLTSPLIRDGDALRTATWDEALEAVVAGFARHHSRDIGIFSCSKATNEMNYLAQKFGRVVLGTNNIDSCNRT